VGTIDVLTNGLNFAAGPALRAYSPRNLVLVGLVISWFLIKSIVEESFLRVDPQYAIYMQKVRARWIPFVA
jgi:hypothetical protein